MSSLTRIAVPRRLVPVALVTALAVLGVTGCQPATAGAAAIMGNDRLSVSELQHEVDALLADGGGQGMDDGAVQRATVERWIYAHLVDEVANKVGVHVTDGDIADRVAQVKAQIGDDGYRQAVLSSGVPLESAKSLVHLVVQTEKIGVALVPDDPSKAPQQLDQERQQALGAAVAQAVTKVDIEVNPRYGEFDGKQLALRPLESGGLATDGKPSTATR